MQTRPKIVKDLVASQVIDSRLLEQQLNCTQEDESLGPSLSIAKQLVSQGLITPWQLNKIYSGKTNGFVVDGYLLLDVASFEDKNGDTVRLCLAKEANNRGAKVVLDLRSSKGNRPSEYTVYSVTQLD